jgi:hypothetical protein
LTLDLRWRVESNKEQALDKKYEYVYSFDNKEVTDA